MRLRVAPNPASSGSADGESPGCPKASLLRRRVMDLRVSPNFAPSGCAAHASSGCPESCTCGWVDDDSPIVLELCILGLSRDESSCPTGSCTFPPNPGCFLNLKSTSTAVAGYGSPSSTNSASSAWLELRSQFPTGSPTGMELRMVRSVEASAKNGLICGFHQSWCTNR